MMDNPNSRVCGVSRRDYLPQLLPHWQAGPQAQPGPQSQLQEPPVVQSQLTVSHLQSTQPQTGPQQRQYASFDGPLQAATANEEAARQAARPRPEQIFINMEILQKKRVLTKEMQTPGESYFRQLLSHAWRRLWEIGRRAASYTTAGLPDHDNAVVRTHSETATGVQSCSGSTTKTSGPAARRQHWQPGSQPARSSSVRAVPPSRSED